MRDDPLFVCSAVNADSPSRMPPAAAIAWGDDGAIRSTMFGDVYASRDGGLAEARHVFLNGCGLPDRWRGRRRFAIGELGFGAGLNCLAAWDLWRRTRSPGMTLHIVSIEGFPLSRREAERALAPFLDVADLAERLLQRWPVRAFGAQRFAWAEDGFVLTIIHEDVEAALQALDHPFDAWFLDGFAPARNPAMWTETILARVKALSAPGARAATYSVSSTVRRGLEQAGFRVFKAPGFGAKRHQLIAANPGEPAADPPAPAVAVIGGGVAGACAAHALSRRGAAVSLWSAGEALADAASGNPAGLVMPRLDRGLSPGAAFLKAAYLFALEHYRQTAPKAWNPCGVRQRPDADRVARAFADLLANPPWPEEHLRAGEGGALFHAQAGMLNPKAAIAAMTQGLDIRLGAPVRSLVPIEAGWRLEGEGGVVLGEAQAVVVAAGAALRGFAQTHWLPVALSAGQIEFGASPNVAEALAHDGYVGPCGEGLVFGATFASTDRLEAETRPEARVENLARLEALSADLAAAIDRERLQSRAAVRATTPDRLPILGEAPDLPSWRRTDKKGPRLKGLWILGGLGARGLTLAPLLADSVASRLCAEPDPLLVGQRAALDPARFLLRALKRGETLPD
ncbi:MAG: FAD-dependent 5-carboxymethylaminomethyl-2-thiouridine(34) oxidoreductase MnmC [Alphaproteobacteria bacterium]|nr:FAD-dependent 5-carboxymethylaminomethyl-2-thiouridine(34) oxidoreductase MnmC [Alphaproteobacteria bacterium]